MLKELNDSAAHAQDLQQIVNRKGTNALAYEGFEGYLFGGEELNLKHAKEDLIHLWVADMSIASPQAAIDAMMERLAHPIFGYSCNFDNEFYDAFHAWCQRRYDWTFPRDQLLISSGVIPALYSLVKILTKPNERVLTFTPAYGFFKHAAEFHGRELTTSTLVESKNGYEINFEDFRSKAADPLTSVFFLCHPHNPTGRNWTIAELRKIAEICFENNVLIISDEIHCDLLRHGETHTPLAKLFPESNSIVTCMSASKTFNLAGLQIANVIIPDEALREKWNQDNLPMLNPISLAAARGVYQNGEPWLNQLQVHLDDNFALLKNFLSERLPKAGFDVPAATYLAWVDLAAYFPQGFNLTKYFAETAGVILEGGEMFVADGGQCIRLNLACPTKLLETALHRIADAINEVQQTEKLVKEAATCR